MDDDKSKRQGVIIAAAEGLLKSIGAAIGVAFAGQIQSIGALGIYNSVVGGVIAILEWFRLAFSKDASLMPSKRNLTLYLLFGFFSTLTSIGWLYIYKIGGEISVLYVLGEVVRTSSLVLLALIFLGEKLSLRNSIGIVLSLIAVWVISGSSDFTFDIESLPLWLLLAFPVAFLNALQTLMFKKSVDVSEGHEKSQMRFWYGLQIFASGILIWFLFPGGSLPWGYLLAIALIMPVGLVLGQMALERVPCLFRDYIGRSVQFPSIMLIGIFIFNEQLTVAKGIGIALCMVSILIFDLGKDEKDCNSKDEMCD